MRGKYHELTFLSSCFTCREYCYHARSIPRTNLQSFHGASENLFAILSGKGHGCTKGTHIPPAYRWMISPSIVSLAALQTRQFQGKLASATSPIPMSNGLNQSTYNSINDSILTFALSGTSVPSPHPSVPSPGTSVASVPLRSPQISSKGQDTSCEDTVTSNPRQHFEQFRQDVRGGSELKVLGCCHSTQFSKNHDQSAAVSR